MKTSKADFEAFKKSAQKWIKKMGMLDWDISFKHFPARDSHDEEIANSWEKIIAWSGTVSFADRVATLYLNEEYEEISITRYDIRKSAFHELWHIRLSNLVYLMNSRYGVQEEAVDMEIHSLIATLENVLFENGK